MIPRTVEIQNPGSYLNVTRGHLKISRDREEIGSIPLSDIGLLIVSNPATVITATVLSRLLESGAEVVICGENFQPCGTFLPAISAIDHHRRLLLQVGINEPLRKNIWAYIVVQKIRNQADVLATYGGDPGKLATMHKVVLSDDSTNMEAQAARYYWPRLMGTEFRRDKNAPGINAMLNYGYTILRGCASRAIVAAGLSPAIPIHHSAMQNPCALADDLMEPLRPMVDLLVRQLVIDGYTAVNPEVKSRLASILTADLYNRGECSTLTQQMLNICLSLVKSFEEKKNLLEYLRLKDSISSLLGEKAADYFDCEVG